VVNTVVVWLHTLGAHYCNGMRRHIQNSINSRLDDIMDTLYTQCFAFLYTNVRIIVNQKVYFGFYFISVLNLVCYFFF